MPETLEAALGMKTDQPDAIPLAGGTDLLVEWPVHPERHDRTYLDLSGLDGLRAMRWTDMHLELGALTTYWDLLQDSRSIDVFPLLHLAAPQVGAIQIQARGTWAGNIANASPAADGVPVLMAYDADVVLASADGERTVALSKFYHGYKQLEMRSTELIRSIRIPIRSHDFGFFEKVGPRRAQSITKVGVAVTRSSAGWRIVANSVAPMVCRCRHVERLLESATMVRSPEDMLPALDQDVAPIDDLRSSAAYRRRVLARLLYFGLREECGWPLADDLGRSV